MNKVTLHCNIDERIFSVAMFLCRFIVGLVLIYITLGNLFYWRDFIYNVASLHVPFSVGIGFGLIVAELFLSLFLILGWFTKKVAFALGLVSLSCAFVFFGGDLNKIFVALCLLLTAPLSVLVLLGPGRLSMDFSSAVKKSNKNFRG